MKRPGPFLLATTIAATAAAQQATAPLDLARVVASTIASRPEILLAAQRAEVLRGVHLAAGAPFDLRVTAASGVSRVHRVDRPDEAVQTDATSSLGVARLFRSGIEVAPDVTLVRQRLSTLPDADATNTAAVGLRLSVPLLQDRGGKVTAAAERAARHDHLASLLDVRQAVADGVLSAVAAYWDYLGAQRRLAAFAQSEARAARTVDETSVLVQADERTAADLTQVRGNLASKRVARIASEQDVVEARRLLGLAMGLPPEEIAALPPPATDFPAAPPEDPAAIVAAPLVASAFARRADLASVGESARSAEILQAAARDALRPRLDLVVGTGYGGLERGLGWGRFFDPLYARGPRLDGSAALTFRLVPANSLARGQLAQAAAARAQSAILDDALRRQIASGVAQAGDALLRGALGLRASDEAVRLGQSTVEAEERKFQLGLSTLFDVIQAQDALTAATLARVASQREYAVAIAALRYESGTLVAGTDEAPRVEPAVLVTPP